MKSKGERKVLLEYGFGKVPQTLDIDGIDKILVTLKAEEDES